MCSAQTLSEMEERIENLCVLTKAMADMDEPVPYYFVRLAESHAYGLRRCFRQLDLTPTCTRTSFTPSSKKRGP